VHAKFDKLSYDTSAGRPYSEISAAVADFCSELKKRDEDTREEVSRALKKKISREEGDVLVEAIPSLQAVLGYNSRHYSDSSCEEKLSDSSEDIVTSRPETSSHKLPFIMKKFMSGISTGRCHISFSLHIRLANCASRRLAHLPQAIRSVFCSMTYSGRISPTWFCFVL